MSPLPAIAFSSFLVTGQGIIAGSRTGVLLVGRTGDHQRGRLGGKLPGPAPHGIIGCNTASA